MSDTKVCTACDTEKPATPEHFHYDSRYGKTRFRSWCRSCVRAYYAHRKEHVRKVSRRYVDRNRERVRENNRNWRRRNWDKVLESARDEYQKFPEKYRARRRLRTALSNGTITKQPCADCGSTERVQGHHRDYDKPLDVEWLCPLCHGKRHRAA